ncbi:MAG: dTDP-4-dehydrorhamnose reductase family protein [Nitrospiraceae bacterium]
MRVLILGGSGMLGHRLWMELSKVHQTWITVRTSAHIIPDLPGVDRSHIRENVEATNFDEVIRAFASIQPDVVINCIGLVKQLPLSNDPLTSLEINALLPHRISLISRASKIRMIHFSTDCVFSGKKDCPYAENDQSDAEDLYGRSKFLGEVSYGSHTLTLRTSIIGRELHKGYGLVEWFLSQTEHVKGYRKAIFSGFTTGMIAKILIEHVLPNPQLAGVYHLSSEPTSKHDLLRLINDVYGRGIKIEPDSEVVCNRALDSSRFRSETGFKPPSWPDMIQSMRADDRLYTWRQ